jgi:thiamine transport system ATP-binding protein
MSGAELRVDGIDVSFDAVHVLRNITLRAAAGEAVALLGASGSGKSTLLRVVAGLVAPDHGTVTVDGIDITDVATHRRDIGMVFQDNQLFPHRSVADNVAFGLKMRGVDKRARRARAEEWLGRVELDGFAERSVTELSGGEAKRVALARTLAAEPSIVLLDEPLTGLDRELHDQLVIELVRLLQLADTTVVLVTHDVDEAHAIADRTLTLADLQDGGAAR